MADAKRCDRCGNYYEKNSKYRSVVRGETYVTGIKTTYGEEKLMDRCFDLCDDCLTALDDFLEMRR